MHTKNFITILSMICCMLAVPSFETNRKAEIIEIFGQFLYFIEPIADYGLPGLLVFAGIVAVWDGISVMQVRYAELMVAFCYQTVPEYMVIVILGKTLGGFITYRVCTKVIKNEQLDEIIDGYSCYVSSVRDLIRERPIFFGLIFRMFFPTIMNSPALAMMPINQSQFVFVQFLHALILSWPQAATDYYPFIDKRYKLSRGIIKTHGYNDHLDILRRAIDTRMDVYKLGFVITQCVALIFFAVCVLYRYRKLRLKYNAHVKLRLL